jgi:hypothetical protein
MLTEKERIRRAARKALTHKDQDVSFNDHPITVQTTKGSLEFNGHYRRDLEKPNWHYYETTDGCLLHFRKEHMVYVGER